MTQFNKNGVILSGKTNESSYYNLANYDDSYAYTPSTGMNSCTENIRFLGLVKNRSYYVEVLVTWKNFDTSNTTGKFDAWFQGSQHDSQGWGWRYANPMTSSLQGNQSLRSIVLSSTYGSKLCSATFTHASDCDGYTLGCRFDYSNGKGWIKLSKVKVIPLEYAIYNGKNLKAYNNEVISQNFIEY